ncbi:TetR/AcrR family transcriptional regulator [Alkalihalobacillus pseudalcaliphilus]|uniref:TetR/AcrR family transcriptional regulator n=1 Tax=Alkalihalobacillus pseudalcaliphilus TaxID=79884 RepID=UPI00064DF590|nr:TetR/AcrR family transcriptional regulator [Alkalihalobacillus pseudalcaliphilus]KMK76068.1 TetR family transcriptional regulator [Alkalihalobacillus pseudalcaliphilus]
MLKNKKETILTAAKEAFSKYGYKATTIDQIAKIANVGKGTIYTTFKNKDDLFNEVLHDLLNEVQDIFHRSISEGKDLIENISMALKELLLFREQHQLLVKLQDEMTYFASESSKRALKEFDQVIVRLIDHYLQQAEQRKKIVSPHRHVTAYLMYKTYMMLVSDYEEQYEPLQQEEIITIFKSHFIHTFEIK